VLILVIGAGSIGQRHIRNLRTLGVKRIVVVDPDADRIASAEALGAKPCASLSDALAMNPAAALVCTPPTEHLPVAQRVLAAGAHVFVEKPLAATLDGVDALLNLAVERQRFICVGYNLRFHPGIQKLKRIVSSNGIGKLLAIQAEFGQYLPDWRKDQDYRHGYHARAEGGGIILDASHEIDYVRWIAGEIQSVQCIAEHLSTLETEAEDVAIITMRTADRAIAEVHLDCVQRGYSRVCKIIAEEGTAIWDVRGSVRLLRAGSDNWQEFRVDCEYNLPFVSEMGHFLDCIATGHPPLVDGATGRRVLEIALAAKQASLLRREVAV